MEGKNKFNTYVVSFDYPSSYSSVFTFEKPPHPIVQ